MFGCYLHVIQTWTIRVTHQFYGPSGGEDVTQLEDIIKRRYHLYYNEGQHPIATFTHAELTKLQEFLSDYKPPEQGRFNPSA